MKRKYIVGLIVIAMAIVIAFKLFANKKKINEKNSTSTTTQVAIPVKAAAVTAQVLEPRTVKTGSLVPFKEAKIVSTTSGNIIQLNFELGDKVQQGQRLAVLDHRLVEVDLEKALSNAAKLKNDLQTYTELLEGKATTQEKVNGIRQDYKDAVSQVDRLKKQLLDANIYAPTSGIISRKAAEQGTFVNAGTEIGTIVNLSKAKIQVFFTEKEVYRMKEGQQVKITTDVYPGRSFEGTIAFISPQGDETHNYLAEVAITNTSDAMLRSGTFVNAEFSENTTQRILTIPREAITESINDASVYVVENNQAKIKRITPGREIGGRIEVVSGLREGELVVTSGQINLQEGTVVKISK